MGTRFLITCIAGWLGIMVLGSMLGCKEKKLEKVVVPESKKPQIKDNGQTIEFEEINPYFKTIVITKDALKGEYVAPASVVASIMAPSQSEAYPIVLFDEEELNELYTSFLQSIAHYNRDSDYLKRVKDMYEHQAATGTELKEAETGVIDAATELAEKEAQFMMEGFNPKELAKAKPGIAWMMSDIPETVVSSLSKGQSCDISFTSFPGEIFKGNIAAIGEVLNHATRTVKVRIQLKNPGQKFKPGMFAKVSFSLEELDALFLPASSVVSVQGNSYVFKKKGLVYSRQQVVTENQIGDNLIILKGLNVGDTVVYQGSMLLKGLSFGY